MRTLLENCAGKTGMSLSKNRPQICRRLILKRGGPERLFSSPRKIRAETHRSTQNQFVAPSWGAVELGLVDLW